MVKMLAKVTNDSTPDIIETDIPPEKARRGLINFPSNPSELDWKERGFVPQITEVIDAHEPYTRLHSVDYVFNQGNVVKQIRHKLIPVTEVAQRARDRLDKEYSRHVGTPFALTVSSGDDFIVPMNDAQSFNTLQSLIMMLVDSQSSEIRFTDAADADHTLSDKDLRTIFNEVKARVVNLGDTWRLERDWIEGVVNDTTKTHLKKLESLHGKTFFQ